MNYKFINNLSLFRTAAIKKFLFINIYSNSVNICLLKRNEPYYKLTSTDLKNNYEILSQLSFDVDGDFSILKSKLSEFIKADSLKDITTIIGINEFKFINITIPNEVDDIDLWFLENSGKFLPEGRPANDFKYSYEKIKEDENHKHFIVVIARNDLINDIVSNCSFDELKLYCVVPFQTCLNSLANTEEKNRLFIDISNDKISYSFYQFTGDLYLGEVYTSNNELSSDLTDSSLMQIKQNLKIAFPEKSFEHVEMFVNCKPEIFNEIKTHLNKIFTPESINKNYHDLDSNFVGSILALNKVLKNPDSCINLLDTLTISEERTRIEKQLSMNIILSFGVLIIFLLAITFVFESVITNYNSDNEDTLLKIKTNSDQVLLLEKENSSLKSNLIYLKNLKGSRLNYSDLMLKISEIFNERCRLTQINFDEKKSDLASLTAVGLAYSQEDVAELIKRFEKSKNFNNVSVTSISKLKASSSQYESNTNQIQFKFTADYNDN